MGRHKKLVIPELAPEPAPTKIKLADAYHIEGERARLLAGDEGCGCNLCQTFYKSIDLTVYGDRVKNYEGHITIRAIPKKVVRVEEEAVWNNMPSRGTIDRETDNIKIDPLRPLELNLEPKKKRGRPRKK
jgi:hypothetical protein